MSGSQDPRRDGRPGRPTWHTYRARRRGRIRLRRLAALVALVVVLAVVARVGISTAEVHRHRPTGGSGHLGRRSQSNARLRPTATPSAHATSTVPPTIDPQHALDIALAPVLAHRSGDIAVGVIDRTTGSRAFFNASEPFHTASIVKADVLAVLLLRHQQSGTYLSNDEVALAREMIEDSDNDAANDLWGDVGATYGMALGNETLGLGHTTPAADYYWGLTTTTVADQLQLLDDLTSRRSPLHAAARSFALDLMEDVTPDQAWGVSAAATPGTPFAVKNGWLPDPELWVINSIGVVQHGGQQLLIAVLSDDQPSEEVGIAQVDAVARAAAFSATGVP